MDEVGGSEDWVRVDDLAVRHDPDADTQDGSWTTRRCWWSTTTPTPER
jgi:hypothetical protein